jgi:pyruvate/2-oxoglutarate dehydrogenase complex dihydrolipoamide acyltransferase (E2) component
LKTICNVPHDWNQNNQVNVIAEIGDFVKADEVIAKIETDKVTVDILAAHTGVITKLFAAEGETVTVGAQLLEFDTDGKAPAGGAP